MTSEQPAARDARIVGARDYLADDFAMQANDADGTYALTIVTGYLAFEAWLRARSAEEPRLTRLAQLTGPFLGDDPRLDGTLYPDGNAIRLMDAYAPTSDPHLC